MIWVREVVSGLSSLILVQRYEEICKKNIFLPNARLLMDIFDYFWFGEMV